jgi:16S rRNA (cytidine1402-2'-O)-methyltransferase
LQKHTSLFIVPTPIGNLEDMTFRAIKVLQSVDTILAEDTRTTGFLLKHFNISKPRLQSHHAFNEHKFIDPLIERLKKGETMALVSDAGTPVISDPGYLLVRKCLDEGVKVECLPGATAFVPALVKSGFPADRFVFEGFLPHKKGRQKKLTELAEESRTMILYESPHRLLKALQQSAEIFGNGRRASISRELTKLYEETLNGTLEELIAHFTDTTVKGEIVIIIEGKK